MTAGWSTEQVHPRDRTAYWVDQICHSCQMDCEPRGTGFFGLATIAELAGGLQVGSGSSTDQVLRRSPRQIARGDVEFFHVAVQTSGRSLVSQDGHEIILEPGDFTLLDRSRPYQYSHNGKFSQILLMLRQDLLLPRMGSAAQFTATRIDGSRDIGGLLSPMLRQLPTFVRSVRDAAALERVAQNILDLIATALLTYGETARVSSGMTLVRVKFWIETHLGGDLSAERIAAECKVTARHLNRLFARESTSLMQYVLERRLARCRRDLTDAGMRHRTISEIAIAAGFKDLSHFSRAYRSRYGRTASEDRMSPEQSLFGDRWALPESLK